MTELSLINNRRITMSSREIANLANKRHDNVMRDIRDMLAELANQGDLGVLKIEETPYVSEQNGQIYTEFHLDKELTITLVAGYSTILRRRIVARWIELESAYVKPVAVIPDFNDPIAAARAWADAKESEIRALASLEMAKPAVAFLENYVEAKSTKSLREVAKVLGAKEREFISMLEREQILFRQGGNLLPFADYQHRGFFEVKTGESHGNAYHQTRFTTEGIAWIAKRVGVAK